MAVDEKKRRFLKHLGIITLGGLAGMALTKVTAKSTTEVVDTYSEKMVDEYKKFIWEKKDDLNGENMRDYKAYLMQVNGGQILEAKKSGTPIVNEVACSYHVIIPKAETEGGKKDDHRIGEFCTAPCKKVCPVSVIKLKENKETEDTWTDDEYKDKKVPTFKGKDSEPSDASGSECIGCGKCFRICGYNAIHWVNTRED